MKGPEIPFEFFENENLEKPGHMRQVPLDRTGVRHRLRAAVLVGQACGKRDAVAAHDLVPRKQLVRRVDCVIAFSHV